MPEIDISQLASLDELGGPSASHAPSTGYGSSGPSAPAYAPAGASSPYASAGYGGTAGPSAPHGLAAGSGTAQSSFAPPVDYAASHRPSAPYGLAAGSGTPQSPFAPPGGYGAPPRAFAPPGGYAPAAGGFAPATGAFRPPTETTDAPIGVERSTRAIRIANAAQVQEHLAAQRPAPVARAPAVAKPRAPIGGVVVAVALIAAVAVAIVVIVQRPSTKPAVAATSGVSIRIIAKTPIAVTIDGHAAGKTPLTLRHPNSAHPIVIAAPGTTKEIIPDRDQVVDLSR